MATFPTAPGPAYGYDSWHDELVTRTDARVPVVQVRDVWNTTLFRASLRYDGRTDTVLAIESFYLQNRLDAFDFFDPDKGWGFGLLVHRNSTGIVVSTSVGTSLNYALPAVDTSNVVVYDDGVVVDPSQYTISAGAGYGGRDRLTFNSAPVAGSVLRVDLYGRRTYRCRFAGPPRKRRVGPSRSVYTVDLIEDPEDRLNAV